MILTDCVKGNFWPKIFRKICKKLNFWAKIENFKEITQKRLIKPAYSERVVIFTIDTIFWRLWTLILPSNQRLSILDQNWPKLTQNRPSWVPCTDTAWLPHIFEISMKNWSRRITLELLRHFVTPSSTTAQSKHFAM